MGRGLAGALAAVMTLALAGSAAARGNYASAPFSTQVDTKVAFGQAPVFMPDGRVVYGKDLGAGDGTQIYIANRDGTNTKCFTCGQPAPNNVPAVRPQGDWILFHSWRGHHITVGSPGFGGLGSALYVQRPDGKAPVQLTGLDAAHGAGEGEDDYHAYWSPDGTKLVWAHLNWNFVDDGGNGNWDIRVADFVGADTDHPKLANIRVVRPPNGHYYETQWWAPDGSGFLYTESFDTAMNNELFFCRLTAKGCSVERLTHNSAWDEQAIFTPDMKDVIFMSTRDHDGLFNTFAANAQTAGLPTDADYLLTLPLFEAGFLQPVGQEATDLYLLDLQTRAVRRLTTSGDDGWIVPEFVWSPDNSYLMWVEARFARDNRPPEVHQPTPGGNALEVFHLERRTVVGRFAFPAPRPKLLARLQGWSVYREPRADRVCLVAKSGSRVRSRCAAAGRAVGPLLLPLAHREALRVALRADGTLVSSRVRPRCARGAHARSARCGRAGDRRMR